MYSCKEEKVTVPWVIKDVTQRSSQISLLMDGQPTKVSIKVNAEVDGNFRLFLEGMDEANTRLFSFEKGIIDTTFYQPWRFETCELQYRPENVQSGQVSVELKLLP